ncbi:MAG: ABC transporter ATP-binding protein/permease [Saccharofermentans sp.]|nr:ABC transporter ATP-binding protein/permease [Saccharofermentans sp.]
MGKEKNKEKLSLWQTLKNDVYAVKLAGSFSRPAVTGAFFCMLIGYAEWVFFDGYFLRIIIEALDRGDGLKPILSFICISAVVLSLLKIYDAYTQQVTFTIEGTKLHNGIYKKIFAKARNVELRCYEDPEFYNKYTMAIDGSADKVMEIVKSFNGAIIGTVASVFVFKLMFDIDKLSVIFILSPIVGNFVFGNLKSKYELKRYREQAPNNKVLNYVNRMMYLPDGAKEIRLSKVFDILKRRYGEATAEIVKTAVKYAFPNMSLNVLRITFTFTVMFEGVLIYAYYKKQVAGTISLAQLTIMTSLMVAATWILIRLFEDITKLIKNGLFINNLRGFLEYEEKIPEDQKGIIPDEFRTLEFRNVSFSYKDEETIKDLSFKINKDEAVALVGHNGAGKTTIIKLLLRLYDPTSGAIFLNGTDIREYDLRAYRELFATTFQDFKIFGMTVKENVLMGRHMENDDEIVRSSLARTGILDKIEELPGGIDSMMTKEFNEDGIILSGGQNQKLAAARTFAKPSPVKIFDEPSSALDPIAEFELFKNIIREGKDHTMLFISHRLSSVKNCDRVLLLEGGRLIEEGTHRELIALKGSYYEMYKRQAMNYLAIENEEEVIL